MKVFDKKVPKQGQKSWSDPALLKPEDSSVEPSAKLVKNGSMHPTLIGVNDETQRLGAIINLASAPYHSKASGPTKRAGRHKSSTRS